MSFEQMTFQTLQWGGHLARINKEQVPKEQDSKSIWKEKWVFSFLEWFVGSQRHFIKSWEV
jgi:predicted alpha/beta-fold hydrolase